MIIKTTFRDNDYTNILQDYWNEFWFKNYYSMLSDIENSDEYEDLKKYKDVRIEADDLLDKAFFEENKMTEIDFRRFEEIIAEGIIAFAKNKCNDSIDRLQKELLVEIVPNLDGKWENGEVVYYILQSKQMVTL